MSSRPARSLRHEYELYVEHEIENYKESIPRSAILAIGDEAAAKLAQESQFTLTELLLVEEVDRIVSKRLRLPKYETWRKKRLRLIDEMRRPEHWGLQRGDALVRAVENATAEKITAHVLVAGDSAERSALYLAANGCDVTAIDPQEEMLERVMAAAVQAGLADRVHAFAAELPQFQPDRQLKAVVCTLAALEHLSDGDRARVIEVLQTATADGGVHLVETIAAGSAALEQLRSTYSGWAVTLEPRGEEQVFLARKKAQRAD